MKRLAQALALLVAMTGGMLLLRAKLDVAQVAMLYVLVVLAASALGRRVAGLITSVLAFVLFNYFFLPPYYTLALENPLDWLVLVTFLVTSVVATELLERQYRQRALAERRQVELDALAALGAETLNAARAEYALVAIAGVIRERLGVERCELFVRSGHGALHRIADTANAALSAEGIATSANATSVSVNNTNARNGNAVIAKAAAQRPASSATMTNASTPENAGLLQYIIESGNAAVLQADNTMHVVNAPNGTVTALDDVSTVRALAIPLMVRGSTVGVLRLSDRDTFSLRAEQLRTLRTLAYYAALGIDRSRLEEAEESAEALRRADAMKDALLAAVSHDLRTPLTNIKAIAHEIQEGKSSRAVIIEEEVDRLAKLVDGLLDLSALNAGAMPTNIALNTVDELVGAALDRAEVTLRGHPVVTNFAQWEELVGHFDFAGSLRVLVNLLENAAKYSPAGSEIGVVAERVDGELRIAVRDRGAGVPPSERERIFDAFYRAPGRVADVRGAGLGLAIARGLAEGQGGGVRVAEREGGGSEFVFWLPGEARA